MSQQNHCVLITGCNRGLGAEFVRQYAKDGWEVIGCCRDPTSHEIGDLAQCPGKVQLKKLDPTCEKSIHELAQELKGKPIDVLINNAGVYPRESDFGSMNYHDWEEAFKVNTMAPLHITEALISNLEASKCKTVVMMTSFLASLQDNKNGGSYQYRTSKAALNMVGKTLSIDLKPKNVKVLLLHPGWVPTRMGGPEGKDDIDKAIGGIRKIISEATMETSGKFLKYDGTECPW